MKNYHVEATRLQKTIASICFVIIFLGVNFIVRAQTLTFTVGPSMPYGLYSSKDFNNASAGMAVRGFACSIIIENNRKANMFNPFIQFTLNSNPIDQDALNKVYTFLKYNGAQVYKPWNQNMLIAGVRYNYFSENFDLFAKAGLGMGWQSTYGYNIYSDSLGYVKFNVLHQNALTFMGGIGSHIYLVKNISICLGYDFFYAANNFGYEKYTNANGVVKAAVAIEVKPPLQTGNFYLGLTYNLKRSLEKK